jgi:predicted metal-binding membrane protein
VDFGMSWSRVQDHRILGVLLGSLAVLAWGALWLGERGPLSHSLLHSGHAAHMGMSQWTMSAIFVAGWILMTIAMMLPTSSPLILLFHRMVGERPYAGWLIGLLVAGYLAVWTVFGLLVHLLNLALQAVAAGIPWLAGNAWLGSAAILLGAGVYQFSSLKYACLDKCRAPMSFLIARWRGAHPAGEAFRLGADHGIYCVGCCWSLMLVMFAVGTGSVAWMLALAAVMALEKNVPWGRRLAAPVGVVLIGGAAAVLIRQI